MTTGARAGLLGILSLSTWLLLAGGPGRAAQAQAPTALTYRPVASSAGVPAGAAIDLPYTFGTHHFDLREVGGEVKVAWGQLPAVSGRLAVPLTALRGGGDTFNCHTREALGLDYAKADFPGAHVCDGGKLPASGKNAVAFPEISFEIKRVVSAGQGLGTSAKARLVVLGRWTIHGVSRDEQVDLTLTAVEGEAGHPRAIRVEGSAKIRLADYGIQVKRAMVITAGPEATVKLNLLMRVPG
jgi:YceI-like domain